jgi:hypothetical protein
MSGTQTMLVQARAQGLIAEAYQDLADETGWEFVSIRALRGRLAGRVGNLDATLVGMYAAGEINLIPQENQMALTPDDRAAAVRCGGENKHLMSWG